MVEKPRRYNQHTDPIWCGCNKAEGLPWRLSSSGGQTPVKNKNISFYDNRLQERGGCVIGYEVSEEPTGQEEQVSFLAHLRRCQASRAVAITKRLFTIEKSVSDENRIFSNLQVNYFRVLIN